VEGPACENRTTEGLVNDIVIAALWILDPTVSDARERNGPRRAPGARVHGGPSAQPDGVCDPNRPREILGLRTEANEMRQRHRRRVAVRSGGLPALPLGGAPVHQHDHKLVQYVEGAHAHVTEWSREAIVPCRRPAPKGGGAAAPASSWRRQNAQDKGISSGGYRSPFEREEGELESKVDAPVRKLGKGGGPVAFRCGRGRGSYGRRGRELAAAQA
jgi:hypothetical protein